MRSRAAWTPGELTEPDGNPAARIVELAGFLSGRRTLALTGAGMSTPSGIPDYRSPGSAPRTPMTIQQFLSSPDFRRHYWARNHLGWRHMDASLPNPAHHALAGLEHDGLLTGVLTQNVDMLHIKAGSRRVLDLHGSYGRVLCLDCGHRLSRQLLDEALEAANPGFRERVSGRGAIEVAPDADAVLADTASFVTVGCPACGGTLKPDIVYFGETVAADVVARAYAMVDDADAVLVVGSSLTVMSGLRFVRHAVKHGKPVVILNRGATRGDEFAAVKIDGRCEQILPAVRRQRPASAGSPPAGRSHSGIV
ncbi:NAD-dependent deacetylase [Gordonia hirsuta DSM 44140 = NBRC 16056]|uniref:NAD-dependent protein deacetylase n=1 Tax=Gordonia hirsuta DSM 44140 = NBRC 16056 TaxID=1121927 RepID=L7LD31_9ACTN|nr:Sir2 family NAD-dependent protein deacetylase [Gordonia hirsuta]GAC58829.1 NAD-dependent deacetylase [Gordonia hirsuta DSM 44140 = NBRC 16056]